MKNLSWKLWFPIFLQITRNRLLRDLLIFLCKILFLLRASQFSLQLHFYVTNKVPFLFEWTASNFQLSVESLKLWGCKWNYHFQYLIENPISFENSMAEYCKLQIAIFKIFPFDVHWSHPPKFYSAWFYSPFFRQWHPVYLFGYRYVSPRPKQPIKIWKN